MNPGCAPPGRAHFTEPAQRQTVQDLGELVAAIRVHFEDKPAGRFRKEQDKIAGRLARARNAGQSHSRTQATGHGHLGQPDGQTAFAQIVTAPYQAAPYGRVQSTEASPSHCWVDPRHASAALLIYIGPK